jgi:hypothetical protein
MERLFFVLASISGGLAVVLGAFGAHTLKGRIEPELLTAFDTGVRYHMYHAVALLAVARARLGLVGSPLWEDWHLSWVGFVWHWPVGRNDGGTREHVVRLQSWLHKNRSSRFWTFPVDPIQDQTI